MATVHKMKDGQVSFQPSIAMLMFFKSYFMRRFIEDKHSEKWQQFAQALSGFDQELNNYLAKIRRPHHKEFLNLFEEELNEAVWSFMNLENAVDRMFSAFADRDGLPTPPPPGWDIDPLHVDYQGP